MNTFYLYFQIICFSFVSSLVTMILPLHGKTCKKHVWYDDLCYNFGMTVLLIVFSPIIFLKYIIHFVVYSCVLKSLSYLSGWCFIFSLIITWNVNSLSSIAEQKMCENCIILYALKETQTYVYSYFYMYIDPIMLMITVCDSVFCVIGYIMTCSKYECLSCMNPVILIFFLFHGGFKYFGR